MGTFSYSQLRTDIFSRAYVLLVLQDSRVFLEIQICLPTNVTGMTDNVFLFTKTIIACLRENIQHNLFKVFIWNVG